MRSEIRITSPGFRVRVAKARRAVLNRVAPAQRRPNEIGVWEEIREDSMGLRVRTYCPCGDLVAGMSYLVRRLLENTSNDSFLLSRARGADLDRLLAAP